VSPVPTLLLRALLVLSFCAATVGAAGFADPVEPAAWPLFVGGMAGVAVLGWWLRAAQRRRVAAAHGGDLGRAGLAAGLSALLAELDALVAEAHGLDQAALARRVDGLLAGPCFDLGAHHEEYARALGPADHPRIWDGFAVAERLLARAWSMATDGHRESALAELPEARRHLLRAVEEASR
jgi:hypothetical protein